jgi:hemolysin activation/secretion protein
MPWKGQWQAVAFVDSADVTINKNAWAPGTNCVTLTGAGAGLNWTGPKQWSTKAYAAKPLGSTPAMVGNPASARAWIEVSKGF